MDENHPDQREREHPYDTDVQDSDNLHNTQNITDLDNTERKEPDDTDVKESDSSNKNPYEDQESFPGMTPKFHIK